MSRLLRIIWTELAAYVRWLAMFLPDSPIGNAIRLRFWRAFLRNATVEHIGFGARIHLASKLDLGDSFVLGAYAVMEIADSDPVFIGNNVGIARGSYVRSANHRSDDLTLPASRQGHSSKQIEFKGKVYSIVIGDNVWIGANAVILTGAFIGEGAIIAAGSVVATEIAPFSIAAGNPARVLANRHTLADLKTQREKDRAQI